MSGVQSTNRELGIARASRTLIRDGFACSCCSLTPDLRERLNLHNRRLANQLPVARSVVIPHLAHRSHSVPPFSFGSRIWVRPCPPRIVMKANSQSVFWRNDHLAATQAVHP